MRDRRPGGFKFRRQHPIGRYIVDFYGPQARLVIEVDGRGHSSRKDREIKRTQFLVREQCRVLRFTNLDVADDLWEVLARIEQVCKERTSGNEP